MQSLPETGFLRLAQILGQHEVTPAQAAHNRAAGKRNRRPRAAIPPIIPVACSTWWSGIRTGRYPKPVKIGATAVWRVEDIRALIAQVSGEELTR